MEIIKERLKEIIYDGVKRKLYPKSYANIFLKYWIGDVKISLRKLAVNYNKSYGTIYIIIKEVEKKSLNDEVKEILEILSKNFVFIRKENFRKKEQKRGLKYYYKNRKKRIKYAKEYQKKNYKKKKHN